MPSLNVKLNFQGWADFFSRHSQDLKDFHFSMLNPIFWLFFVFLFLIGLRFWRPKKSFSFSSIVVLILLATTKFELMIGAAIVKYGETFDPLLMRIGAIFLIAVVWLYYTFLTSDN